MAVDYGDARTGVAVCDREELLASPVGVIRERSQDRLLDKLQSQVRERNAELLVVGLPKNMDGSEGYRAQACREFAGKLESRAGLPVVMRDERLTTVQAHNLLNDADVRGKKRKNTVDALAAVLILEEYLSGRKDKGNLRGKETS